MADRPHRQLRPIHGIHVIHSWDVSELSELNDEISSDDVGKVARQNNGDGVRFWVLASVSEGGDWHQLDALSASFVTWEIATLGDLTLIEATESDQSKVARVADTGEGAPGYFILGRAFYDGEQVDKTWLRLDNTAAEESPTLSTIEPKHRQVLHAPLAVWDLEQQTPYGQVTKFPDRSGNGRYLESTMLRDLPAFRLVGEFTWVGRVQFNAEASSQNLVDCSGSGGSSNVLYRLHVAGTSEGGGHVAGELAFYREAGAKVGAAFWSGLVMTPGIEHEVSLRRLADGRVTIGLDGVYATSPTNVFNADLGANNQILAINRDWFGALLSRSVLRHVGMWSVALTDAQLEETWRETAAQGPAGPAGPPGADFDGVIVTWIVDPEGFPSSIHEIDAYEEDVHKVAYDPSGTTHYYILEKLIDDGEGGIAKVWRVLDTPVPDLTVKADKIAPRVDFGGNLNIDASHPGKFLVSTGAALQTVSLHADTGAPGIFPVQSIPVWQSGAGKVRFVAGGGATLLPPGVIETQGQYALAHVTKVAANTWLVSGEITIS